MLSKQSLEFQMTKVLIYTDFDGTVTGRAGGNLVFTPFYKSLLTKPGHYKMTPMKEPQECQALFVKEFGEYKDAFSVNKNDTDRLMSQDAVAFFHYALNNKEIKVKILTRNRHEYIKAMFAYQGFTEDEIANIEIDDYNVKSEGVATDIWQYEKNKAHLYVMDDDQDDYESMKRQVSSWDKDKIHGGNEAVGQFKWNQYLEEVKGYAPQDKEIISNNTNQLIPNTENQNGNDLDWEHLSDDEKCLISIMTRPARGGTNTSPTNISSSEFWATLDFDKRQRILSNNNSNLMQDVTKRDVLAAEIDMQVSTYSDWVAKENKAMFYCDRDKIASLNKKVTVLIAAKDVLKQGCYPEYLKEKEESNPGWDKGEVAVSLVNRVKEFMNIPLHYENNVHSTLAITII